VAATRKLTVVIAGDTKGFSSAIDDTDKKVGRLDGTMGKLAKTAGVGLAAAAVAGGAALWSMAEAAAEDEQAQKRLGQTLKNTTNATSAQVAGVESFISGITRATGVMDDELRPAFDVLVRGTKDITLAQDGLTLAMDVAAGTGLSVTTVAEALSMAYEGNTKKLRALTPEMSTLIREGATTDEMLKTLSATFAGQADVAADTTAGKMAILRARFAEFQEEIGAKVLPVIDRLVVFADETLLPAIDRIRGAFGEGGLGGAVKETVALWNESQPELEQFMHQMMNRLAQIIRDNSDEFAEAGVQIGFDIVEGVRRGMLEAGIQQIPGAEKAFTFLNRPGQGTVLRDEQRRRNAQSQAPRFENSFPGYHTGGIFHAPTPGGEGWAKLRDRERISTPGVSGTATEVVVMLDSAVLTRAISNNQRAGGEPMYVRVAAR
jgi:hypothetical protein